MDLKNKLKENTELLMETVAEVPESKFNIKPKEGGWSVADVVEHLYRSEFGIPKLLQGETQKDIDRAPDAFVEPMRKRFLQSDQKMKASDVILPTEGEKSKKELISKFQQNRMKIIELIGKLDTDELCLSFKHPLFGYLTRQEWARFNIIHTQRHLAQIQRIIAQLN